MVKNHKIAILAILIVLVAGVFIIWFFFVRSRSYEPLYEKSFELWYENSLVEFYYADSTYPKHLAICNNGNFIYTLDDKWKGWIHGKLSEEEFRYFKNKYQLGTTKMTSEDFKSNKELFQLMERVEGSKLNLNPSKKEEYCNN